MSSLDSPSPPSADLASGTGPSDTGPSDTGPVADSTPGPSQRAFADVLADDLPDALQWVDFGGRVVHVNAAACRALGHPREVYTTLHVWDFDVHMTAERWAARSVGDFPPEGLKSEHRRADGTVFPVEIRGRVVDVDGVPHYLCVVRDITDFRRLEKEARDAAAHARAILDHLPDIAWMKDLNDRFIAVNRAFADAFGWEPARFVGLTDAAIFPPEHAARYQADDATVIATARPLRVEEPLVLPGMGARWIETIKTPVTDDRGVVIGTVGVARDITWRKLAEEGREEAKAKLESLVAERTQALCAEAAARRDVESRLREQRMLMETLIDATTVVVFVKDLAGRYVLVNRHLVEWVGCRDKAALIGKTAFDLFPTEIAERLAADDAAVLAEARPIEFEEVVDSLTGLRTVLSLKVPLLDADGAPYALCCVATDITERKEAARLMEVARDAAEVASRAKSEFLCVMSHELRTPLNAILGFAEILGMELAGPLTPKQKSYVTNIGRGGDHLLRIINDILDYVRVEADQMTLNEAVENVAELLADCVALGDTGRHVVSIEVTPDTPDVWADGLRLRQVIINLLGNAVKFSAPGTAIVLGGRLLDDGDLELAVRDQGAGIKEEDIPRVLEMFAQADTSMARRNEGTGVGLPLAAALVRVHGGRLELNSAVGVGTTARVLLPSSRVIRRV